MAKNGHGSLHAKFPDLYDENDIAYPNFAPAPLTRPTCTHVVGSAWMLNPEEGQAWVVRLVPEGGKPDESQWVYKFQFCPCCGARLEVDAEDEQVVKSENAIWR